jgi:hypothetical protein
MGQLVTKKFLIKFPHIFLIIDLENKKDKNLLE